MSLQASFPQMDKRRQFTTLTPGPQDKMVSTSKRRQITSQQGLEFLFSPLLEEYYNPTHGQAEENNNNQAPNASFQEDEFINPYLYIRYSEKLERSSSRNIDKTDVAFISPQSNDYPKDQRSSIKQVCENPTRNPTCQFQTRRHKACRKSENSFSDANHAGCLDTFDKALLEVQFLVINLYSCCAQEMWMRNTASRLWLQLYDKTPLYCYSSSQPAAISCNPVQHSHSKPIILPRKYWAADFQVFSISELQEGFESTQERIADSGEAKTTSKRRDYRLLTWTK
ncbi:hypothetical protein Tco_0575053 [Tanacetum coccineum]